MVGEMKKIKRSKQLQNFLDNFAKKAFGKTTGEAQKENVCVFCGKGIKGFRDYISEKEYRISGSCQSCQDEMELTEE